MKGQANPQSYISLLIFVIGLSLIIYILMLPPSDRADLLEQNRTSLTGEKDQITVLMSREPGTLTNLALDELDRDLPGFTLSSKTDAKILMEFDSIYVKKSLFEESMRNISFKLPDKENYDNFVLSFRNAKRRGMLTIYLNGNVLTSDEFTSTPAPIRLPKDWLKDDNQLAFRVNGPGIEFWNSNEYLIQDMKITADYTDVTGRESKSSLFLTVEERDNLDYMEMNFPVYCKDLASSPIEVYLNKRQIYKSVPDCDTKTIIPKVDASWLREGSNDLLFRTEKGHYLVDQVNIMVKLKKPIYPTYYFNINEEDFAKIKDGTADLNVTLLFTNEDDLKKGVVLVNGIKREIQGYDKTFNWKVNSYARSGNNAVEIIPKVERMNVLELKVLLSQ
ncbi:MAG: hypothetical protein HGA85_04065 [Nanoarchaeota archaeon]|nr:hypothetical protein [Nanoarchaeota archaeon]